MPTTVHLTAPVNWINDPNGLVRWDGRYHVFFQHHPAAPAWGRIQWGHASSADLAHWTRHPPALVPSDDPRDPDHDGCWSGCIAIVDGVPTAFYTGAAGEGEAHREAVCRAASRDDLTAWHKDPGNPIVDGAPRPGRRQQRDPFVFRSCGRWLMLLGTGLVGEDQRDAGGAVVVLESEDTRTWHDRGVLFSRPAGDGAIDTGPMWECPQLFPAGDRWVLLVSIQARGGPDPVVVGAVWFLGHLIDEGPGRIVRFAPESTGWLDGGNRFYAPAVLVDAAGPTRCWGWIPEPEPDLSGVDGPVTVGALSVPRVLDVHDNRVTVEPAPELDRLALEPATRVAGSYDVDDPRVRLPPALRPGGAWRVRAQLDLGTDPAQPSTAGLVLAASAGATTGFAIGLVRGTDGALEVAAFDLADGIPTRRLGAPLPATAGPVSIDVIVDGTIVEAFAAGVALTTRIDRRVLREDRLAAAAWSGTARFADLVAIALSPAATIDAG